MKKVKQDSLAQLQQIVDGVKSGRLRMKSKKRIITHVSQVKDFNDAMAYAYAHENIK